MILSATTETIRTKQNANKNHIYTALYVFKRRNNTHARKVTTDSRVNMRIGITAGQNDERGDQGLARTVDKN